MLRYFDKSDRKSSYRIRKYIRYGMFGLHECTRGRAAVRRARGPRWPVWRQSGARTGLACPPLQGFWQQLRSLGRTASRPLSAARVTERNPGAGGRGRSGGGGGDEDACTRGGRSPPTIVALCCCCCYCCWWCRKAADITAAWSTSRRPTASFGLCSRSRGQRRYVAFAALFL